MSPEGEPQTPEQRLEAARSWAADSGSTPIPAEVIGGSEMTDRLQGVIAAAERAADAIRHDAEQQAQRHLMNAQRKADEATAERLRAISRLTDDLVEQAGVVRRHSEQMVGALEHAIETIGARIETPPTRSVGPGEEENPKADRKDVEEGESARAPASDPPPTPVLDAILADRDPGPDAGAAPSAEPSQPGAGSGPRSPAGDPILPALGASADPPDPPPPRVVLRVTQLAMAGESREAIGEAIAGEFGIDPTPVLDQLLWR